MNIAGEDLAGVYPSMEFLKAWNLRGESLATGSVGVVGGGNSALDAARVALRQKGVTEVTIFYRRTREEMPAFDEEIEGALEEGIKLELLASPVELRGEDGTLTAAVMINNELGEVDNSGRRRPVAKAGSEHRVPLDTLIVAISEAASDVGAGNIDGLEVKDGAVATDPRTMATGRIGVFAGGDVATGPNTVIDAIAAGRRAANAIRRYLQGQDLLGPAQPLIPMTYLEPVEIPQGSEAGLPRVEHSTIAAATRSRSFAEVEETITAEAASLEATRCLRCDLEFTKPARADDRRQTAQSGSHK
jgi:NADH-quinone oxidoreductase subunit F